MRQIILILLLVVLGYSERVTHDYYGRVDRVYYDDGTEAIYDYGYRDDRVSRIDYMKGYTKIGYIIYEYDNCNGKCSSIKYYDSNHSLYKEVIYNYNGGGILENKKTIEY